LRKAGALLNIARAHALVNCFNQHDGGYVKRKALIAIALLIATKVVFAQNKHPADMAAIDAAMQTAKLTPAQRAEVLRYRKEGQQLHNSGKHGRAEIALQKAKSILKI
jgi:hypothetical protein